MKKKILILLLSAAVLGAGCGAPTAADSAVSTEEAVSTESTETKRDPKKDNITYTAGDYVELGDYKGMEVEVEGDFEVTDQDVRDEVELEISYRSGTNYVESDKTVVEDGDTVNIDYVGKKDGVAFEGGTAEGYNLSIGSGTFIPGFEEGLVGAKVGDTLDLDLTFPEEYHNADLAGQDVVFTVTVNSIMEEAAPVTADTLTDEWVKANMGPETVDEYLKEVRESLEDYMESEKETAADQAVLEKLREICKVTGHPEGLEEERVEQSLELYRNTAESYGMSLDDYLTNMGQSEEELRKALKESAGKAVDSEIIMLAIADAEGISDDEEAFQKYLDDLIKNYGYESEEDLFSEFDRQYVHRNFRADEALKLVRENAKITYKNTAAEVIKAEEDAAAEKNGETVSGDEGAGAEEEAVSSGDAEDAAE